MEQSDSSILVGSNHSTVAVGVGLEDGSCLLEGAVLSCKGRVPAAGCGNISLLVDGALDEASGAVSTSVVDPVTAI